VFSIFSKISATIEKSIRFFLYAQVINLKLRLYAGIDI